MSDVELVSAIPVLPVSDVPKAVEFYRDRLGFSALFQFGPYAGIGRGPIEIHLDGSKPPDAPVTCRINVRGVDKIYAEVQPKGVVHPGEPLETKPHGMRQFSVLDLSGNRITFAEPAPR